MNFRQWITRIGADELRRVTCENPGTIRVWAHRQSVPRRVWPSIQRAGLATLTELLTMEQVSRR